MVLKHNIGSVGAGPHSICMQVAFPGANGYGYSSKNAYKGCQTSQRSKEKRSLINLAIRRKNCLLEKFPLFYRFKILLYEQSVLHSQYEDQHPMCFRMFVDQHVIVYLMRTRHLWTSVQRLKSYGLGVILACKVEHVCLRFSSENSFLFVVFFFSCKRFFIKAASYLMS